MDPGLSRKHLEFAVRVSARATGKVRARATGKVRAGLQVRLGQGYR